MRGKIKDPRVIAAGIAVACMLVDDLPDPEYGTFRDPGAAAMLSIVLADATTLWSRQGSKLLVFVTFWIALALKFLIQPIFCVRNAWVLDIGTLLLAHGVLGLLAVRVGNLRANVICFVSTVSSVVIVLFILYLTSFFGSSWVAFYWQLAAARVLIPAAFWSVLLFSEAHRVEGNPNVVHNPQATK